ncbi:MAG: PadR family transcriptional regulator [Anaerolineae bacterium]|nr:PadR family transcriptional regulator [Anaerolineae bacterium]
MTQVNTSENYLPLTETTVFILLSLLPGAKHGYAIMKEVQALSNNRIMLSTGTLYGALKRLLEQTWIQQVADPIPNETERSRKAYALTELGKYILNAEVKRLNALVTLAQHQIAGAQI